jgi:DNA-binding NarL/FixJ family response regulator
VTRVAVIAASGSALANLTAAVAAIPGAFIVRHGSSAAPLDRLLALVAPDLILIADLSTPDQGLARLAEMRQAAPAAKVVVFGGTFTARWLEATLGASVLAVLPAELDPQALGRALCDALAEAPAARRPTQDDPGALEAAA